MPEILLSDEFGSAIQKTILAYGFTSAIEIGSWDGTGSTHVLASSLQQVSAHPSLVTIENAADRFAQLQSRYALLPWVKCHHGTSVSRERMTPRTFEDVWNSPWNRMPFVDTLVRQWWNQTISDLEQLPPAYLEDHPDDRYDVALIDGNEFLGWDEYSLLRDRVSCLMLDDVFRAYKCSQAHSDLRSRPEWECIWSNSFIRNGSSIWVRRSCS